MGRPKQLRLHVSAALREHFPILTDELVSVAGWGGELWKLAD